MRIIGLTGGIASGKSTVASLLEKLGACIVDADKLAWEAVKPGQPAWQEIVDWLGPDALLPDGSINRQWLADKVFSDRQARAKLEGFIHPRVRAGVCEAVAAAHIRGEVAVVLDIPLLFETGWTEAIDETWVVKVDAAIQLTRLMGRNGFSRQEAETRINSQMSLEKKALLADVVIDNSKDFESTKKQVEAAWQRSLAAK
ncbi:MAG: dephospho-CoA kinase [Negativicutes bacterium]|nr:dephospho-CoA kinase [Negativicutes bacterium]